MLFYLNFCVYVVPWKSFPTLKNNKQKFDMKTTTVPHIDVSKLAQTISLSWFSGRQIITGYRENEASCKPSHHSIPSHSPIRPKLKNSATAESEGDRSSIEEEKNDYDYHYPCISLIPFGTLSDAHLPDWDEWSAFQRYPYLCGMTHFH